jgi:hypothetical protein
MYEYEVDAATAARIIASPAAWWADTCQRSAKITLTPKSATTAPDRSVRLTRSRPVAPTSAASMSGWVANRTAARPPGTRSSPR